jgi:hypothetical protein
MANTFSITLIHTSKEPELIYREIDGIERATEIAKHLTRQYVDECICNTHPIALITCDQYFKPNDDEFGNPIPQSDRGVSRIIIGGEVHVSEVHK